MAALMLRRFAAEAARNSSRSAAIQHRSLSLTPSALHTSEMAAVVPTVPRYTSRKALDIAMGGAVLAAENRQCVPAAAAASVIGLVYAHLASPTVMKPYSLSRFFLLLAKLVGMDRDPRLLASTILRDARMHAIVASATVMFTQCSKRGSGLKADQRTVGSVLWGTHKLSSAVGWDGGSAAAAAARMHSPWRKDSKALLLPSPVEMTGLRVAAVRLAQQQGLNKWVPRTITNIATTCVGATAAAAPGAAAARFRPSASSNDDSHSIAMIRERDDVQRPMLRLLLSEVTRRVESQTVPPTAGSVSLPPHPPLSSSSSLDERPSRGSLVDSDALAQPQQQLASDLEMSAVSHMLLGAHALGLESLRGVDVLARLLFARGAATLAAHAASTESTEAASERIVASSMSQSPTAPLLMHSATLQHIHADPASAASASSATALPYSFEADGSVGSTSSHPARYLASETEWESSPSAGSPLFLAERSVGRERGGHAYPEHAKLLHQLQSKAPPPPLPPLSALQQPPFLASDLTAISVSLDALVRLGRAPLTLPGGQWMMMARAIACLDLSHAKARDLGALLTTFSRVGVACRTLAQAVGARVLQMRCSEIAHPRAHANLMSGLSYAQIRSPDVYSHLAQCLLAEFESRRHSRRSSSSRERVGFTSSSAASLPPFRVPHFVAIFTACSREHVAGGADLLRAAAPLLLEALYWEEEELDALTRPALPMGEASTAATVDEGAGSGGGSSGGGGFDDLREDGGHEPDSDFACWTAGAAELVHAYSALCFAAARLHAPVPALFEDAEMSVTRILVRYRGATRVIDAGSSSSNAGGPTALPHSSSVAVTAPILDPFPVQILHRLVTSFASQGFPARRLYSGVCRHVAETLQSPALRPRVTPHEVVGIMHALHVGGHMSWSDTHGFSRDACVMLRAVLQSPALSARLRPSFLVIIAEAVAAALDSVPVRGDGAGRKAAAVALDSVPVSGDSGGGVEGRKTAAAGVGSANTAAGRGAALPAIECFRALCEHLMSRHASVGDFTRDELSSLRMSMDLASRKLTGGFGVVAPPWLSHAQTAVETHAGRQMRAGAHVAAAAASSAASPLSFISFDDSLSRPVAGDLAAAVVLSVAPASAVSSSSTVMIRREARRRPRSRSSAVDVAGALNVETSLLMGRVGAAVALS